MLVMGHRAAVKWLEELKNIWEHRKSARRVKAYLLLTVPFCV